MSMKQVIAAGFVSLLIPAASCIAAGTELADAVMSRDSAAVRSLLKAKADVNAVQPDGSTALHWAVYQDDAATVDLLIAAGANAKAANREGATPLYLACVTGNAAIIDKLLKAGADANGTVLLHGETPLMVASRSGRIEAVKLLLDRGAQVNAKETLRQTTPLMWASEQNHPAVVKLLVERGADVNAQSKKEPLKKQYGVVYAMKEGAQMGGMTPLVLAAREGALDSLAALLAAKADPNKTSGDGSSALLVAIQNGHYDIAKYLVSHGADVNLANDKGWNPLYLAVKHRNIETGTIPVPNGDQAMDFIKVLLDHNVNVNARVNANTEIRNGQRATWLNEVGATPFLRAALCGDIEVMKLLLAHGADPKIDTEDHTTPLMAAAGVGFSDGFIHDRSVEETLEAMKLILDLGADPNAANEQGLTALHGAAHKAALGEIQLLVDRGASLAAKDKGSKAFGQKPEGLLPLNWAEGVPVGVQSAIYHADAVELITKLMKEKGIPIPTLNRTVGGNAVIAKKP
jgi:uncharacterized protein